MFYNPIPSKPKIVINHLFQILVSCGIIFSTYSYSFCQRIVLEARKVDYQQEFLTHSFQSYQILELNTASLFNALKSNRQILFQISFGDHKSWSINLVENDIRSSRYKEVVINANGQRSLPKRENITYQGFLFGRHQGEVRLSITAHYLRGLIEEDGQYWFIEPLFLSDKKAPENYYVLYKPEDVLAKAPMECGYLDVKRLGFDMPEHKEPTSQKLSNQCYVADLVSAATYDLVDRFPSIQALNDHILTIINLVSAFYEPLGIHHEVVAQFAPESEAVDPFGSSYISENLLISMRNFAKEAFPPHDLGQLWTARNIEGCGGSNNPEVAGCAVIGGACNSLRYSVCEHFSSQLSCLSILSAHEIGHNWNARHHDAEGNPQNIMYKNLSCSVLPGGFSTTAGNAISAYASISPCISTCSSNCDLTVDDIAVDQVSCFGNNDGKIILNASSSNGEILYSISGPVEQSNTTGIFPNLPFGFYEIMVQDDFFNDGSCFKSMNTLVLAQEDNTPPVLFGIDKTITFNGEDQILLEVSDVLDLAASHDNCSNISIINIEPSEISCVDIGSTIAVNVFAKDAFGNTSTCTSNIEVGGLPCGYHHHPESVNCLAGGDSYFDPHAETLSLTNHGCFQTPGSTDAWSMVDYAFCGDFTITAKVSAVVGNGQGGISIRESMEAGAKMVSILTNLTPVGKRIYRYKTGENQSIQPFIRPNSPWMRIIRKGNKFMGYLSSNGIHWALNFLVNIPMENCIYAGFIVQSNHNNAESSATFSNISLEMIETSTIEGPIGTPYISNTLKNGDQLTIFPNPVKDKLHLFSEGGDFPLGIEIWSADGSMMKQMNLQDLQSHSSFSIDVANLPPGIYFLGYHSPQSGLITKRFIKNL